MDAAIVQEALQKRKRRALAIVEAGLVSPNGATISQKTIDTEHKFWYNEVGKCIILSHMCAKNGIESHSSPHFVS